MDRAGLEQLLGQGLSLDAMAEKVGRSPSTVAYWLRRHGLRANGSERFKARPTVDVDRLRALVGAGLSVPQIAEAVERTPGVVRRALAKHGLQTRQTLNRAAARRALARGERVTELVCLHHGLVSHVLEGRGTYRCIRCRGERVSEHRRRIKRTLIAEAGGACVLCGYNRCEAALQFHHLDPERKDFHLSLRGVTRSWEELRREAAKCVLLCATCHAEVESGYSTVTKTPRGGLEPPNLD
jgi:hypothetical protein